MSLFVNQIFKKFENLRSVLVYGNSGIGKTTLLKNLSSKIDASIVLSDPKSTLTPHLKIYQILEDQKNRFDLSLSKLFKILKLPDSVLSSFPYNISGGESFRVALIRALMFNKPYLLLDEPFSSIDLDMRQTVLNLIFNKTNSKILVVSHQLEGMECYFDCIARLEENALFFDKG